MCVLAIAWHAHPRWPLIVAANRDELHARPSAPLARWPDDPAGVIAGRDLQSGGTWLGVTERGRFAAVTNLRGYGLPDPDRASRGALVTDMLTGAGAYADPSEAQLQDFNPFNLIVVGGGEAQFLTNRPGSARSALAPGVYGLSNGALDAPWPKTLQLKAALLEWIVAGDGTPDALFDALCTESLPDFGIAPSAPSDVPQEAMTSPVFIRNPIYGTRCSTVVAVDGSGLGTIMERRFGAAGEPQGDTILSFDWKSL